MNQTHILKFASGNRVVCKINVSGINRLKAQERLHTARAVLEQITWHWDEKPLPALLAEYRPFAQRMYGIVAQLSGLPLVIRGPAEAVGLQEGWCYDAAGTLTIQPIVPRVPLERDPAAQLEQPLDLDALEQLGRLSQQDAQNLHTILCHQAGMKDPDAIMAAWNVQQPLAPWDCPPDECKGPYVDQLTQWVLRFMREKLRREKS